MIAMCVVQLKDGNDLRDLVLILVLDETFEQMAMASNMRYYGHVFRCEEVMS